MYLLVKPKHPALDEHLTVSEELFFTTFRMAAPAFIVFTQLIMANKERIS